MQKCWAQGLVVDCANGVGAAKLQVLADRLAPGMAAELRNTGIAEGRGLNESCGADFLQKERRLPAGFHDVPDGARCRHGIPFLWTLQHCGKCRLLCGLYCHICQLDKSLGVALLILPLCS